MATRFSAACFCCFAYDSYRVCLKFGQHIILHARFRLERFFAIRGRRIFCVFFYSSSFLFFSDESYRQTERASGPPHSELRIRVFGPAVIRSFGKTPCIHTYTCVYIYIYIYTHYIVCKHVPVNLVRCTTPAPPPPPYI